VLRGSGADRKLDIFLTPADAALPDGEHDWSNVLVIGEHKRSSDEDGSIVTLVELAGYAREVFGSSRIDDSFLDLRFAVVSCCFRCLIDPVRKAPRSSTSTKSRSDSLRSLQAIY